MLLVNQWERINLSDVFNQLQALAYRTGQELSHTYGANLFVAVSEQHMAFIVIYDNTVIFSYQIGDRI